MKKSMLNLRNYWKLFLLFLISIGINSCDKVKIEETYKARVPIYLTLGDVRAQAITLKEPTQIQSTGKIYLYKDYLFINEPGSGIHIYNNIDPAKPVSIGFLPIKGNFDLGIKNDLLYADNIVDLLTFDISNISKPVLINRQKNAFIAYYDTKDKITYIDTDSQPVEIIGYKDSLVNDSYKKQYEPRENEPLIYYDYLNNNYNSGSGGQIGIAGSMARFAISGEYLYAIYQEKVKNFSLKDPKKPEYENDVVLGFGIETLFPYKKSLFVGANNGMHILDISNPTIPKEIGRYVHALACDPVVVNDTHAFVTLRSGNVCGGNVNMLEVVDIKDPKNPQLVHAFSLSNPHGLTLSGDYLYVSEGDYGLKSFKINDVTKIDKNLVQDLPNVKSRDLIAGPKSLIVLNTTSICQFDYSNKANLKQLSCIEIKPKK